MSSSMKPMLGIVLILLFYEPATAGTPPLALPNCRSRCGDTPIPYPFGIGQGCYKNKWYEVVCNGSIAFLTSIQQEVAYFSLEDAVISITSPVISLGCPGGQETRRLNLTGSPFVFSIKNFFTTVGCNSRAMMTGAGLQILGCETTCKLKARPKRRRSTICVGFKCCQITIPPNLQVFEARLESLDNNTAAPRCQVAFLTRSELSPSMFTQLDPSESRDYLQMQLDWHLDDFFYIDDDSYVCWRNMSSILTNYEIKQFCRCRSGYKGNPYIYGGCQDIDECKDPSYNSVCGKDKCVNIPGSFKCEKTWPAILGGSLGLGFLLLVVGTWWLCKVSKKRKSARQKRKFFKQNGGLLLQQQVSSTEGNVERTKVFSSKELEKATDKFNEGRILGQGGQGTVYKGMLPDGRIVAVKKSRVVDKENLQVFINEIIILSQINHRHVVKILGCCLETEVPILVYEFIPNGNLFEHLHCQSEEFPMTWEVRLRIASEAASAISYLHSAASIPIYHRDIKSTNILLDQKYQVKVSDFGISRSITTDQTHLTTIVQGTIGYVDPEYFQSSQFTEKSDVYSFGVVLVELLTGEKPVSELRPEEGRILATYFLESMLQGRLFDILDARIKQKCNREEVASLANLARRCLRLNGKSRPTMREVSAELEKIQSRQRNSQAQYDHGEEMKYVKLDLADPLDIVYTSPTLHIDGCCSSLDAKPLVPRTTW